MLRPALYILLYTITGILFGIYSYDYSISCIFIAVIIVLTFIIVTVHKNLLCCLLMPVALLALSAGASSGLHTNSHIESMADTDYPLFVEADVCDIVNIYDDITKYKIKAKHMSYNNTDIYDSINMYMYVNKKLNIGDTVEFKSTISHGNIKRNEADFDEIRYFKIKGIEYKTFPDDVTVTGHSNTLGYFVKKISLSLQSTINKLYPQREAGLMTAMLLGDRNNLDDELYDLYREAGIVHIIAISGMHISILAGIILILVKPLGRYISSAIVILFMCFYIILTGGSVSVVRSGIMMFFYILSGLISRKYDLISSTALACTLLLFVNPYYIFDLGFQYSFIAVFTIGFTSEILKKYKIENKFINLIVISIAISLTTKPITVYNFYYINCIDFIVNILVVSLSEFILIFGLISAIVGTFMLNIGVFLSGSVYVVLKVIEYISEFSLSFPFAHVQTGAISMISFLLMYIALIFIYKILMGKIYAIFPLVLSAVILFVGINTGYDDFEMYVIYVGQGDCAVIRDDDKCYIMDAGSSEYKNYGEILFNELQYNNINKIDGIYISHMDYDHMGGVTEVAELMPVENIYISEYCDKNENYNMLIDYASENNINIEYVNENYEEQLTENMSIKLVYTDKNAVSTNNSSAVYKVTYGGKSILFTGDIDSDIMDKASDTAEINADILKVPHHGSSGSISEKFVAAVSPELAVNSAGNNNIYGHPSGETIAFYNSMDIPFLSTNYNGMVKIRIIDNEIYYKLLNTKFKPIQNLRGQK